MNPSREKSDIKRIEKITFKQKLKRSSSGQKDTKMTLSQEEIIKLGDYLNLNNHQKNQGEDNIIRHKLSVLEKQINKSDNQNVFDISKYVWRWTTLSKSR